MNEQNMCFLVVDGEFEIRRQMIQHLKDLGCHIVEEATDGRSAFSRLKQSWGNPINFVITGTTLPNMDGFQLVQAIRADPERSRLPVLVMVNEGQTSDVTLAASLGANGYIMKPLIGRVFAEKLAFIRGLQQV